MAGWLRRILVLTAVLFVVCLVPPSHQADKSLAQTSEPPNIILVLTDDLNVASVAHLPRLKSLMMDRGTTFENAFVSTPLCCPSRSSTLRGQYTHNHRVFAISPPMGGHQKFRNLGREKSTVATWLRSGGYRTILIGKYLNGYDGSYVPPGWDRWYGQLGVNDANKLNENGKIVSYDPGKYHDTDVFSNIAVRYLKKTSKNPKPFFMYLAPNAPHTPAVPAARHKDAFRNRSLPRPPSFNERDVSDKPAWVREKPLLKSKEIRYMDALYRDRLRSMLSVEDMLGRLFSTLKDTGELENTYVVFTSDNGFHMGQHRLEKGKITAYEEDIRVPLMVRGPGVPAGRVEDRMALNTDLAPTFAGLAGIGTPDFVDGRSLAPLLTADPPPDSWRSAFLVENLSNNSYVENNRAVRTGNYLYVEYPSGDRELYDLEADPYQLDSLHASADPALVGRLESRLASLRDCAGEACRAAENGETAP